MKHILTTVALVAAGPALAEFWDGNKLYERMLGAQGDQLIAIGYVMGVADTLRGVTICPPPTVTAGQANDVVRSFLERYPQNRHLSADVVAGNALTLAWPCARRNPATPSGTTRAL